MINSIKSSLVIFKYWYWQDIEKSHIFPRILNLAFSTFLSLVVYWAISSLNISIFLKYLITVYSIINIFSFWPYYNYVDENSNLKGTVAYIFKKYLSLFHFSFYCL